MKHILYIFFTIALCLPLPIAAAASSSSTVMPLTSRPASHVPTLLTLCSKVLLQHPTELLKGMQDVGYKDTSALKQIVTKVISDKLVATNKKKIGIFRGHKHTITALQLSPDNTTLYSGSEDFTIRAWDTNTHQQKGIFIGHQGQVTTLQLSSDGTLYSGSRDKTIRIWCTATYKQVNIYTDCSRSEVQALVLSPDETTLYSGSRNGIIYAWHTTAKQQYFDDIDIYRDCPFWIFTGHKASVNTLQISPDGSTLYSESYDGNIRTWNTTTNHQIGKIIYKQRPRYYISSLALQLSSDGTMLYSALNNCLIRACDTKKNFYRYVGWHHLNINALRLSPDNTTLYSGSEDGIIRAWNTAGKDRCIGEFDEHGNAVKTLQLNPDGTILYSGLGDGAIHAWRVNYQADLEKLSSKQLLRLLRIIIAGKTTAGTSYAYELDASIIKALPATEALLQPSQPPCTIQ